MNPGQIASDENLETDIVIVGGGGAGLAASVSAAEKGAKIILLEKRGLGGNSALAQGLFAADSPLQRSMNVSVPKDEAFKIAAQDRDFYDTSGGGVTISGGEPLLQWEFVRDLFKKCKDAGFHTALDTTAYCLWENLEPVLRYTDLILFDVKHMDPVKHEEKTGVSNELILENLDKASNTTKIWLRIPLIPGYNDSESNMQKTAELASKIKAEKISILPYHEWGKDKYSGLGKQYDYDGADGILEPDSEVVKKCRVILESHGVEVKVGK